MVGRGKDPKDEAYCRFKDDEKRREALATMERWRALKGTVVGLCFIAAVHSGSPLVVKGLVWLNKLLA